MLLCVPEHLYVRHPCGYYIQYYKHACAMFTLLPGVDLVQRIWEAPWRAWFLVVLKTPKKRSGGLTNKWGPVHPAPTKVCRWLLHASRKISQLTRKFSLRKCMLLIQTRQLTQGRWHSNDQVSKSKYIYALCRAFNPGAPTTGGPRQHLYSESPRFSNINPRL
jgi:hypothetical protein